MRTKILLFVTCLVLFSGLVYAGVASASWSATIHAEGEALGGVKEYDVIIGIGPEAETLPAPPAPPAYSVKMDLYTPDWEALYKDIRQEGETSYIWAIGIDPHGNIGAPDDRSSTISWDPSSFATGDYELREGYDGTGQIVVADMRTTTSYDVTGGASVQYFTINVSLPPNRPPVADAGDD